MRVDRALDHPLLLEFGWQKDAAAEVVVVPPGTPPPDGHFVRTPVAHLCGDVWFRAVVDVDGSGATSRGDTLCREAGADGKIPLVARRGGVKVVCHLGE